MSYSQRLTVSKKRFVWLVVSLLGQVASLEVGPGDLKVLHVISRLQKSSPLGKMADLTGAGSVVSYLLSVLPPQALSP